MMIRRREETRDMDTNGKDYERAGTLDGLMHSNMKLKRSSFHLGYYHILIFIISHLWSGTDSESLPGYSINVAPRVTVQRRLCAFIPCNFTVPETVNLTRKAKGRWHHAETGQIAATKINSVETKNNRFFLVGDIWKGDCTLYIENPLFEDEGRYYFRVEDIRNNTFQDIQPYINVTELESKPEISPIKSWREGEEVTLNCTSPATCMWITSSISWQENIQKANVKYNFINHEYHAKTHSSTITFIARKEQNNSTLACIARLNGKWATRQQIILRVESPKTISELKSHCQIIGNHTECTCVVQSFSETIIQWKIDDKIYNGSDKDIHISTSRSDLVINSMLSLQSSQKYIPYITCMSSKKYGDPVLDPQYKKSSMDYGIIGGIVAGNLIILLLIALGAFWYAKRHLKKKLETITCANLVMQEKQNPYTRICRIQQTPSITSS